jgi:hypothetical protein
MWCAFTCSLITVTVGAVHAIVDINIIIKKLSSSLSRVRSQRTVLLSAALPWRREWRATTRTACKQTKKAQE